MTKEQTKAWCVVAADQGRLNEIAVAHSNVGGNPEVEMPIHKLSPLGPTLPPGRRILTLTLILILTLTLTVIRGAPSRQRVGVCREAKRWAHRGLRVYDSGT